MMLDGGGAALRELGKPRTKADIDPEPMVKRTTKACSEGPPPRIAQAYLNACAPHRDETPSRRPARAADAPKEAQNWLQNLIWEILLEKLEPLCALA